MNWCKRFFGSFFVNEYARESAVKGTLGTLLGFIVALLSLIFGLFGGYYASFGTHYNGADDFRKTLYAALEDTGGITFKGGAASADKVINSFNEEDKKYSENGYEIIVDTRPYLTTFCEFTPYYALNTDKNNKDLRISEEEYGGLSDESKKKYTFGIEWDGEAVDTLAGVPEHEAYLSATEGSAKEEYSKLSEKKDELGEKDYADELYVLYAKTRYPDIGNFDIYSGVPTMRTYYFNLLDSLKAPRYAAVFDNMILGYFVTESGVAVDFAGTYDGLDGTRTFTDGASADKFVFDAFNSAAGVNLSIYFMNALNILMFAFVAFLLVAIVNFILCRIAKLEYGARIGGSISAVGSFLFVGGIVSGVAVLLLSFALPRSLVSFCAAFVLGAVLLVRTVVLTVCSYVKRNRECAESVGEER